MFTYTLELLNDLGRQVNVTAYTQVLSMSMIGNGYRRWTLPKEFYVSHPGDVHSFTFYVPDDAVNASGIVGLSYGSEEYWTEVYIDPEGSSEYSTTMRTIVDRIKSGEHWISPDYVSLPDFKPLHFSKSGAFYPCYCR